MLFQIFLSDPSQNRYLYYCGQDEHIARGIDEATDTGLDDVKNIKISGYLPSIIIFVSSRI